MSKTQVAAAVIVLRDSKILLLKRKGSEGSGTWSIPGGKVDFMEDPKDACARELLEETGLTAQKLEFVHYTNDIHEDTNKHFVTLRFVCRDFIGEPKVMEPLKSTEIGWFSVDDLPTPMFKPTMDLLNNINMEHYL